MCEIRLGMAQEETILSIQLAATQSSRASCMGPPLSVDGHVRESITVTSVGEQVLGFCGIIFQLLPQMPDVGSQILKFTPVLHAPDSAKNPSVGHCQTGVQHQIMQKIKFSRR